MANAELLLTSCKHVQQWSACLWDHISGSVVHYYKNGGIVAPKSLNLIGNDYLFTCDEEKPLTHVWAVNSQEPTKKMSTVLPEKPQVMTVCPKSSYLAAGIGVKLYVWLLSSGKLFAVEKRNFQPITCIKFSNDGFYLIVGGQEGMLIVYDLVNLVSFNSDYLPQSEVGQVEPVYTKHDHSMSITDIHIGNFRHKSRLATVSIDHTCKIYTLYSGELLLTLVFDGPLTSVVFDGPCWNLFVGMNSGEIQQFLLREPPRTLEHHVSNELVFQGHKKRVSCLCLNMTYEYLVSGSDDKFVYIWDIHSRQILKSFEHKAEITNALFVMNHENFSVQNLRPKTVLKNLSREVIDNEEFLDCKIQDFDIVLDGEERKEKKEDYKDLEAENERLRSINKELYQAALSISRKYNKV